MITRRTFLRLAGTAAMSLVSVGAYAGVIEPRFRLVVTRYTLRIPRWTAAHGPMRIAVIADLHACEPWMPPARIAEIVAETNRLAPDLTLLLGDYVTGIGRFSTAEVPIEVWAAALGGLSAPLGVHGVLGNHDCGADVPAIRRAFAAQGITLMENAAQRLATPSGGAAFWLAGLGDQIAWNGRGGRGLDDLPGTLAQVTDDAPVLMMAHEPDIFARMPDRVSLTVSGHTHGGQVRLPFVGSPLVPSHYGQRYVYGHIVEDGKQIVVSGGLGCSLLPVRFGRPPEIVLLDIVGAEDDGRVA
ncbi:metallophosphoesterase [Methylobrevis albus]|uniref:Metallophosphoesterase n=1 Tax=Methylobrevis albus TaxID=2793297 RepID=A0A931I1X9_9HYPH|nr:metallophosphoesterase [Methylobrevis albus]MBH0237934.1 metallophosphoesterase [Methylobrevis albus]